MAEAEAGPLSAAQVMAMAVVQLRDALSERGLSRSGIKQQLKCRLLAALREINSSNEAGEEPAGALERNARRVARQKARHRTSEGRLLASFPCVGVPR